MLGLSATLTEAVFVYLCICVFVFVYLHVRHLGTLFLRSLYHYLSENIWFVWSKTLHNGEKLRCYACDTRTHTHVKVEQYSAEAESAISLACGRVSLS